MNAASAAKASAVTFVWLGMVPAISFLEAPLKFRAPGVSVRIGLGIGRLVFRALNVVECVLATAMVVAVAAGDAPGRIVGWIVAAVVLLVGRLAVIRPRLNRRSDRVLAGEDLPRSRGHLFYVAFEAAKVVALLGLGVTLLAL
ncbi:hypothetical protein OIE52_44180 [Streptomyces canus]|uniref:hypothetical protein n=1 Tax=Streptomyces canus TaxID=58343 RepID=UPI003250D26D